ncbi:hypothetical protein C8R44DRAFT_803298 [Mycena epipterygia]|nr:hypothetical protein C8R44DRAFT_803298 [Mycena epipterygia]
MDGCPCTVFCVRNGVMQSETATCQNVRESLFPAHTGLCGFWKRNPESEGPVGLLAVL